MHSDVYKFLNYVLQTDILGQKCIHDGKIGNKYELEVVLDGLGCIECCDVTGAADGGKQEDRLERSSVAVTNISHFYHISSTVSRKSEC